MDELRRWIAAKLLGIPFGVRVGTVVEYECYRNGKLVWKDGYENLVVTVGRNKLLDACFKTGLAAPAWYAGLKDTGTPDPADTMASHATWAEITPYSNATRPAFTPGAISGGSVNNSAAKASFNINATDTIYGGLLADDNEKGGVGGVLYGAGDFGTPRDVIDGDVLNVQITLNITAV